MRHSAIENLDIGHTVFYYDLPIIHHTEFYTLNMQPCTSNSMLELLLDSRLSENGLL